jgi:hypothetical protein
MRASGCDARADSPGQAPRRWPPPRAWRLLAAASVLVVAGANASFGQDATASPTSTPTPLFTRTLFPTCTASPTVTRTPTPAPASSLIADANCDGVGSAADLTAAIIVSYDPAQFPGCHGAESFRGRPLTNNDFLAVFADLFDTFGIAWTPTPTASRTVTATPTRTRTATATARQSATATTTPSASPTLTATPTPTSTPTSTPTPTPAASFTPSRTRTATPTRPPPPTPTPTGLAYQLSGRWFAHWNGNVCFLLGQPFLALQDATYQVTALDDLLDIQIVNGDRIGRGLALDSTLTVHVRFRKGSGHVCQLTGVEQEFLFDYTFTFNINGTGSAIATWSFGANTNCENCQVFDTATLVRVAGPAS